MFKSKCKGTVKIEILSKCNIEFKEIWQSNLSEFVITNLKVILKFTFKGKLKIYFKGNLKIEI